MRKISAHAAALESDLGSGPGGARVLIAEAHIGLNEIADLLHARQPVGVLPNSDQASFINRSVSQ